LCRPFFSKPIDVGAQILDWFASGVIGKTSGGSRCGRRSSFRDRLAGRPVSVGLVRANHVSRPFRPYVKGDALPRVVLAGRSTMWLGLGIWSIRKVALRRDVVF